MDGIENAALDGLIDETQQQGQETEGAEQGAAAQGAQDQEGQQQQAPEDKVDGRSTRFSKEWSQQMRDIRTAYPGAADMLDKLRDAYGRTHAYSELAPKGIDEIRGWKQTVDALGGPEAAANLMTRAAEIEQIDERIAAGDVTVVGDLPEPLQKGLQQMIPALVSQMAEKDQAGFAQLVQPHFQRALAGTGLGEHLQQMEGVLGDNPQALQMLKQLQTWFQQQTSGAAQMPKGADPYAAQRTQLEQERAKFTQQQDEMFTQQVTTPALQHRDDAFNGAIDVYKKQLGLTDDQVADLKDSYLAKMNEKMNSDKAFQAQLKAFKTQKNRSVDAVASYIRGKVDEYAKPTIDALVTARYGSRAQRRTAAPANNGSSAASGGPTRVAQRPPQTDWDMDKMEAAGGYANTAKKGLFYLKDGRTVQLTTA